MYVSTRGILLLSVPLCTELVKVLERGMEEALEKAVSKGEVG